MLAGRGMSTQLAAGELGARELSGAGQLINQAKD